MTVAVILAIVIFVVVVGVAGFFVLRSGRGRGGGDAAGTVAPPDEPKARPPKPPKVSKPKAPKRRRTEPTEEEVAGIVEAAEAILAAERARETPPGEPSAEPSDTDGGDDGGGAELATGVGLLEREPEGPPEPPGEEPGSATATALVEEEVVELEAAEVVELRRPSFRERLSRTRRAIGDRIADIRLKRKIDDEVWEELEEALILADVGADLSVDLVERARVRARDAKAEDADSVLDAIKTEMVEVFASNDRGLHRRSDGPSVWLVVGVNGTGKTTTIGKLANTYVRDGDAVVLAAADTFRAAAADQLGIWAERCGADIVRGEEGADPGAIVFDAVSFTRARDCDLLLVDTAGRLHTKVNLMEELKKIRRVAENAGGAPDEVLLVLDATTGQNGLAQARQFADAAGVTGVVLTKLDGTAKGGIALAIEREFGIPIKLVGLGEGAEDLVPFDAAEFVDALFAEV